MYDILWQNINVSSQCLGTEIQARIWLSIEKLPKVIKQFFPHHVLSNKKEIVTVCLFLKKVTESS